MRSRSPRPQGRSRSFSVSDSGTFVTAVRQIANVRYGSFRKIETLPTLSRCPLCSDRYQFSGNGVPTHASAGQRNGSNAVSGILSTTRNVIVAAAMR